MISIEDRIVYEVSANTDLTEGRGPTRAIGWFFKREDAVTYANGRGVMGTPAHVEDGKTCKVVCMYGDYGNEFHLLGRKIIESYDPDKEIRINALAKLSAEEKRVLGL